MEMAGFVLSLIGTVFSVISYMQAQREKKSFLTNNVQQLDSSSVTSNVLVVLNNFKQRLKFADRFFICILLIAVGLGVLIADETVHGAVVGGATIFVLYPMFKIYAFLSYFFLKRSIGKIRLTSSQASTILDFVSSSRIYDKNIDTKIKLLVLSQVR